MIAPSMTLLSTAEFHPRLRLMKLANKFPSLFDVAYSGVHQTLELQWGRHNLKVLLKDLRARMMPQDFWEHAPKFKFILIAPGVTQSHQLTHVLRSGSVPLLVSDATFEHLWPLLKPWEHYVPIQPNLTDLVPTLQRLLEDDAFAQGIARNAQALAAQRLRPSGSYCYLTKALQRLHAAVDGSVGRAEVVQSKTEFMEVEEIDLREVVGFVPLRDRLDLIKMDRTGCRKRSGAVSGLLPVGGTGSSRQPRSGRQALFEEADPLEVTALAALQKRGPVFQRGFTGLDEALRVEDHAGPDAGAEPRVGETGCDEDPNVSKS
ncbi:Protein O-glucosyltransferase 2 (Endoplasmic reticulum resident protein 58) (ER protein 58) (ERp58) (KDEL motif-containing protein 1) (Protein O-xylosyltransferase POGLUT2) [Durusdinium trenchii]